MTEDSSHKADDWGLTRLRALIRLGLIRVRRLALMQLSADEAQSVREHVEADGALTERFVLMCALSAGIAILGMLQSSSAVVIGAMLVSPLMGPIAALGFGMASFDGERTLRAARALAAGAAMGVLVGVAITLLSPIRNATPEIIARTAPTLLDLAVALLSGFAGGYATVHRRGETAIGVAIATALMPPLAALGYSIAVWRLDFIFGAGLLFLTNLAAIAFAFALVSRLRGVSRPLKQVKITKRLAAAVIAGLVLLVVPLGMTLRRLTQETFASRTVRQEIVSLLDVTPSMIAQLAVTWTNLDAPRISAIVVTTSYREGAEEALRERLTERLGIEPELDLQQLVATDSRAETEALISAALSAQTQAQRALAAAPPPIEALRAAANVPTLAAWADSGARVVHLLAAPAAGMSLLELQREEARLAEVAPGWGAELTPAFEPRLTVEFEDNSSELNQVGAAQVDAVVWALRRWGASHVRLEGFAGRATGASAASRRLAGARAETIAQRLRDAGLSVDADVATTALSRALFASGGSARVRGVDVMARAVSP